jgi:hypothetical protein
MIFLDGRGVWRECDGVSASGSLAVRRVKDGSGLSVIVVEGVDRFVIRKPRQKSSPADVRTALSDIAGSKAITVRARDADERESGEIAIQRVPDGWEVRPPAKAVRLEIRTAEP